MNLNARPRLENVDIAKGIAIALVVWGHIVAGSQPEGNPWYGVTQDFVYLFHMPFFMFLSGIVAGYGYRPVENFLGWRLFVWKKATRLLPAYFLLAVLIVLGKSIASQFLYVDNVPTSIGRGVLDVLFRPADSSAKSLWFIYVLFFYYLVLHPLMLLFRSNLVAILIFAIAIQLLPAPDFLLLNRFCKFLQFFALGMLVGKYYLQFEIAVAKFGAIGCLLFLILASEALVSPYPAAKVVVGWASIPAMFYLIQSMVTPRWRKKLLFWGRYSFVIYLFNTIFIGLVKAIGFKVVSWNGAAFLLFFPLMFMAGQFLPIVLKKQIFSRLPWFDKITD